MSAKLKYELYESFYPDQKDQPITISDYVDKLHEVIRELKASTPRRPIIEWSSDEVKRWTSNLPVKGLKEVAEEVLANIDGAELASFTEEDLEAAGMNSKIHRKQLIKARDLVVQRDSKNKEGKGDADDGFGQALGLLSGSMGDGEATVQQAEAFELLAEAATKSKKLGEATSLLRKALEIRGSLQGDEHLDVAGACDRLAAVLEMQEQDEEAEDLLWRALKISEEAAPASNAVLTCLERLIVLLDKQGRAAECTELAERADSIKTSPAMQIIRDYVTPDNVRKAVLYTIAAILFLQLVAPEFLDPFLELLPGSWRYQYKHKATKAKLAIWERYHGPNHAAMTPYLLEMARVYESGDKGPEAYDVYGQIVAICKEQGISKDPIAATALGSMGRLDATNGDLDTAQKHLTKAIAIYTTTGDVFDITELGFTQGQLAEVLRKKGKYKDALPLFKQAVGVMQANDYAVDDGDLATTLAGYGSVLAHTGLREEASKVTMQAVNLTRDLFVRAINDEMLNMVLEAGETMETMGDHLQAGNFFKQAATIAMKVRGAKDETVARSLANLASCLSKVQGKGKEAELVSRESVNIAVAGLGPSHPRVAYYYVRRAGLMAASKRFSEAEELLSSAKDLLEAAGEKADQMVVAMYHVNMGGITMPKDPEVALDHMRKVVSIREAELGPKHPQVGDAASNLATSLAMKGQVEESTANVAKAEAAWIAAFGEEQGTSNAELLKARIKTYFAEAASNLAAA